MPPQGTPEGVPWVEPGPDLGPLYPLFNAQAAPSPYFGIPGVFGPHFGDVAFFGGLPYPQGGRVRSTGVHGFIIGGIGPENGVGVPGKAP